MSTEEQDHDVEYESEKEFQAKFLLNPDIPEEVEGQFNHLDKNLAITNLRASRKEGVNEPDEFRNLARAMHILNNPKYYKEEITTFFTGEYREVPSADGKSVVSVPVYGQTVKIVPRFPKTFHAIRSDLFAFSCTSASRGGHRMRSATTTRRVKEESFEQKSSVANRWSRSKN